MKSNLTLIFFAILLSSACASGKLNKEGINKKVVITIENFEELKNDLTTYSTLRIKVSNNMEHPITIPLPTDNSDYIYRGPDFIKADFPNGVGCSVAFFEDNQEKDISNFKKIAPNESIDFDFNITNSSSQECEDEGGQVIINYYPDPKWIDRNADKIQSSELLKHLLKDSISSKIYEF